MAQEKAFLRSTSIPEVGEGLGLPVPGAPSLWGTRQTLISISDLSDRLGLPLLSLKRMAANGEIPCLRIGSGWRFNLEAVERVLMERAAHSYRTGPVKGVEEEPGF